MELAADDEPHAQAGANGEEGEVVDPPCDSEPLLADSCEVDVILQRVDDAEPIPELVAEGTSFEARDVRRKAQGPAAGVDDAGDPDDDAVDPLGWQPDRREYSSLVEMLEEWRGRALRHHLVKNINEDSPRLLA